jgi:hypothetical protein
MAANQLSTMTRSMTLPISAFISGTTFASTWRVRVAGRRPQAVDLAFADAFELGRMQRVIQMPAASDS